MAQLLNLLEGRLRNIVFGFEVHNNLLKRDSYIRHIQIKTNDKYTNKDMYTKDKHRAWTEVT